MPSLCPNDGEHLVPARGRTGLRWSCPSCSGVAFALPVARHEIDSALLRSLWQRARAATAGNARACPDCRGAMRELAAREADGPLLEVCTTCHLLWLDAGELESVARPDSPSTSHAAPLSAEARRAVALLEVEMLGERADQSQELSGALAEVARRKPTVFEWLVILLNGL